MITIDINQHSRLSHDCCFFVVIDCDDILQMTVPFLFWYLLFIVFCVAFVFITNESSMLFKVHILDYSHGAMQWLI